MVGGFETLVLSEKPRGFLGSITPEVKDPSESTSGCYAKVFSRTLENDSETKLTR